MWADKLDKKYGNQDLDGELTKSTNDLAMEFYKVLDKEIVRSLKLIRRRKRLKSIEKILNSKNSF